MTSLRARGRDSGLPRSSALFAGALTRVICSKRTTPRTGGRGQRTLLDDGLARPSELVPPATVSSKRLRGRGGGGQCIHVVGAYRSLRSTGVHGPSSVELLGPTAGVRIVGPLAVAREERKSRTPTVRLRTHLGSGCWGCGRGGQEERQLTNALGGHFYEVYEWAETFREISRGTTGETRRVGCSIGARPGSVERCSSGLHVVIGIHDGGSSERGQIV